MVTDAPAVSSLFPLPSLPRVISDFAFQQLAVGKDDLLARIAAHASGFQTDVLHLAAIVLDRDLVANYERLVRHNGDGGEKVAEDVLNGERNRQTADSETGQQWLDLDTGAARGHRDACADLEAQAARLPEAQSQLKMTETELQEAASLARTAAQELGQARQMVSWLDGQAVERQTLVAELAGIRADSSAYDQLADAFGKNGIQEMNGIDDLCNFIFC